MKFNAKKSASRYRSRLRSQAERRVDKQRFRQVMFETLEDRRVLSATPAPIESWRNAEFVPHEAIVHFNSGVTRAAAQQELFLRSGGQIVNYWNQYNMAQVRFSSAGSTDVSTQLNQIAFVHSWNSVDFAEPNFIQHLSSFPAPTQQIPDDTRFAEQYGLNNTGYGPTTPDADIDAPEAWLQITGDPKIVVAVVDSGGDLLHPDLIANKWVNPLEVAGDGVDNDNNGFIDDINGWDFVNNDNVPQDDNEHGTHVAGIIGAVGDNGIGVSGVAWNVKLMHLKAANAAGGLSIASILGSLSYINTMKTKGINILFANHSYGGTVLSLAQQTAMAANEALGILDVCAAGNSALDNDLTPHYPSSFPMPNIISVAATDRNDLLATFSQWGETSVDLAAPGDGILSTVPLLSDPSGYAYLSGTSMATPMVTGSLVLFKAFDPTLNSAQLKDVLLRGVDSLPSLNRLVVTGGRLNVNNSLNLLRANTLLGTVFEDVNGNAQFDASEVGMPGWTVYVDLNDNRSLDAGEPRAVSGASGGWRIRTNIGPGVYNVREIVQPTYRQTLPTANGPYRVTLVGRDDSVTGIDFGNQQVPGEVHGRKWNDLNADGVMDPGEPGIQGVVIYVDVNNDRKIGIGEPAAVTDSNGFYTIINVGPGTYNVREVYQPGFQQIFPDPTGTGGGANTGVVVTRGTVTRGINFGNKAAFDYGDAPLPYPTLNNKSGAVHGLLQGFQLGTRVDAETNGLPSVGANGDDLSNLDDEDGIVIGNLTNNSQQTLTVTASTGIYAAGYLQGWIDFNRDGDWNDAGERIFTDVQLTTGTTTLAFTVPNIADNLLGPTYARFRYSLQHGIGPTGSALGGEVEDYLVNILGPNPTAINDSFTVDDNSLFFQNPLDVLANDLPSTSGPPGLFAGGLNTTGTLGEVQLNDNGTPADPTDDFYEYQPPSSYVGLDSFKYSVKDPNGNVSGEATVTINVRFVARDPIAVDNTFDVLINSLAAANKLDVMANDVQGTGGAVRFSTQTPPAAQNGTVTLDDNGTPAILTDDFYRYAPDAGFTGQDSFDYTIVDSLNKTSSGHVTIQVVPAPRTPFDDAIIQFELKIFSNNVPLGPGAVINVGDHIQVQGIATDLRPSPEVFDPSQNIDFTGVFSAYMDLLFDKSKFQTFGTIQFSSQYQTSKSGLGGTPGLIDEIGATYSGTANSPGAVQRIFTREFVAIGVGLNVQFTADPADASPSHDITAFVVDPNPLNSKVQAIPTDQVYFLASLPIAEIMGLGEGEDTNRFNPTDVNVDGKVTPIDALLVINWLNQNGQGGEEGESSGEWKRDVNHDNQISPIDALLVINYLNQQPVAPPAGEAEGEADDAVLSPVAISPDSESSDDESSVDSSGDAGASAATVYAASVDQIIGETDWTSTSATRSEDFITTKMLPESDDYFLSLGSVSRRERKGL